MPISILVHLQQSIPSKYGAAVKRACTIILICTSAVLIARSTTLATYHFDDWSTENGLPQNSIHALLQTRDGYLWLTTSDGLVRFDGVRFTVFERGATPGLSSNRLSALFEDHEGTLWIGTEDRGAIRYKNGRFTSYTTEDGLPHYQVSSFGEDKAGRLIVSTSAKFAQFQDNKFVPYPVEFDLPLEKDFATVVSHTFRSFSIFDSNGLHRYENGHYKTYGVKEGLPAGKPASVYEDQRGNLWVTTKDRRLFRLRADASIIEAVEVKSGLPDAYIDSVYDDQKGSLWISTRQEGLAELRDGALTMYGAEQGFHGKRVNCSYEDREGNVWLGTYNEGLYKMRQQTVGAYTEESGLSQNNTYTVYEDREGSIWVGTLGGGLNRLKDGKITTYRREDGLAGNFVTALYEDRDGNLWAGTYDSGLSRIKDGRIKNFGQQEGLYSKGIYAITQARSGEIWFGTLDGLYSYQNGVFKSFTTKEGIVHARVQALYEDGAGNLWIGTFGGVSRFKDGVFTNITEQDGLSSNHVRSIYEDADGIIWIGTYDSGLNRLKDGKITRYTTREGLYNNGIFQILEDASGYFWISCNRGVYRVSRRELNDLADGKLQSVISVPFDKSDGMPSSECNGGFQPAGWKTRDGRMIFPTQGGLAIINPELIRPTAQPPPVIIESLILDRKSISFTDRLEISPGQENLEIQYTGLSFIKPDFIRFKYRLEGLDNDWVEAGTRRAAYYSHLAPGQYTFNVIAANSDGIWNTRGASIRIIVRPPFWRTWWFLSLAVAAIVGAAFLAYEFRVLRLKKAHAAQEAFSRQLIESQEQERKRIAAELHDSLGQNLLIIKNRALMGLHMLDSQETAREQLNEINSATTQAIEEVREIAYNLRPYHLDRLGLTSSIEAMIEKIAATSEINFSAEIENMDGLLPKESEINLYRIIQESINNIVKHSRATSAQVKIARDENSISITIQDDGRGFLLEPTTDESKRRGFGLTGIAERVRMLGGTHSINSALAKGTILSIRINLPHERNNGRDGN